MAKRFRFRLEPVLKLRKQKEDEHKRIVAGRIRQLDAIRRRVAHIERQIAAETESIRRVRSGGTISAPELARGRHWLSYLQRCLLETRNHQGVVEAHLARERAELARVAKDAKAIEKLKERKEERFLQDERRAETKELDETAILRFQRPGADGDGSTTGLRRAESRNRAPQEQV
jgi:flagellar FliJ protein